MKYNIEDAIPIQRTMMNNDGAKVQRINLEKFKIKHWEH